MRESLPDVPLPDREHDERYTAMKKRAEAGDGTALMEIVLTRAYEGSLLFTAFYLELVGRDSSAVQEMTQEQIDLAKQISLIGVPAFAPGVRRGDRLDWLDAHAASLAGRSPLFARYAELGRKRWNYLPKPQ